MSASAHETRRPLHTVPSLVSTPRGLEIARQVELYQARHAALWCQLAPTTEPLGGEKVTRVQSPTEHEE